MRGRGAALLMSSEAADTEVGAVITRVRDDGRDYMEVQIAGAYADLGPARAAEVAAQLSHFAIVGFDGSFIAWQSNPARAMVPQMANLAVGLDALAQAFLLRQE